LAFFLFPFIFIVPDVVFYFLLFFIFLTITSSSPQVLFLSFPLLFRALLFLNIFINLLFQWKKKKIVKRMNNKQIFFLLFHLRLPIYQPVYLSTCIKELHITIPHVYTSTNTHTRTRAHT
jgi:hypothetical protein